MLTTSRGETAVRGLLAIVLGAVLMVWPGITIGVVIALFAIFVFADAIVSAVRMFGDGLDTGDRVLLGLRSVIEIGAGIVAIAYPGATASVMTVVIGVYAITLGITELSVSRGSGWLAVSGVLSTLTGLALVVWPDIGAVTLALVFGAYLAIAGVTLLVSAVATPSLKEATS
jgi:uncharacterized membrane protein HdeD (DUF308 family)